MTEEAQWYHCINCTVPFQLTEEWSTPDLCCEECADSYADYLNDPGSWQ